MDKVLSKKAIKQIFSLNNVVGIGYGLKEVAGQLTDQEAIIIMVSTKFPESKLPHDQVVPKTIEGTVSDVIEVGHVTAGKADNSQELTPEIIQLHKSRKSRWRPAPGGVSIGHYKITAGTLGALVYDQSTGKRLILSNNHILANSTNGRDRRAKIGDPILQPGPLDGGTVQHDTIARLYRFVPLRDKRINVVDAAVAKPLRPSLVVPYILGIGTVQGTTLPKLGMEVKKSGRTTRVTHTRIRAIKCMVKVDYDGRIIRFRKQILTDLFSAGGDSGSLVLDEHNRAVGLLFAGSERYTFVNPIDPVLKSLHVSFKRKLTTK